MTLQINQLSILLEKYPNLKTILKSRIDYLKILHDLSQEHTKDKSKIFFASTRHLSSFMSSQKTWSRNINILATIGLIKKHHPTPKYIKQSKALQKSLSQKMGLDKSMVRFISFLSVEPITKELLKSADEISNQLISKGFTARTFTKKWLSDAFSKEFASSIFLNTFEFERALRVYKSKLQQESMISKNESIPKTTISLEDYVQSVDSAQSFDDIIASFNVFFDNESKHNKN